MNVLCRCSASKGYGRALLFAVLTGLLFLSAVMSLCLGAVYISPSDTLHVLLGNPSGTAASIILYARLPRTVGCLLAGTALAVSGAVIQSVLSNPLAAPNIIGVNSGAGMMAALCCAVAPASGLAPLASFLGAQLSVMLVLFIAEKTGAAKITLVLAGISISSLFGAGIDTVVTFVPEALNGYSDFRIGGLSNLSMARVAPAAVIIVIALISALAGAAVSFSGLLGFVGLIVPHIARRLAGEESLPMLTASALGGASMLTICDLLARLLFAPYELPVGIVLSFVGVPFFIWLLLRQRGGRIHD